MAGAASWSFSENDFKQIQQHLQAYLRDSNARCALLVDRTGQLVATVGEPEFASLVHQGERESMYLADVAKRVILVVLFDQRATLGLVKLKAKAVVESLNKVFAEMFNRVGTGPAQQKGLLEGAEDEIDKLFG